MHVSPLPRLDDSSWITGETIVIDGGQMIGAMAAADAATITVEVG